MNPSLKKFVSQRIVWERQHCLPRPEGPHRLRGRGKRQSTCVGEMCIMLLNREATDRSRGSERAQRSPFALQLHLPGAAALRASDLLAHVSFLSRSGSDPDNVCQRVLR